MSRSFALGSLAVLLAWGGLGQSDAPAFEVASVKPAEGVGAIAITPRRSGNRISYVTEMRMVLFYAYRVQAFQVSGDLPGGVYNIEAIVEGSPGEDQIRLMFQRLLADRFRLRLHRETKEMRVYELVVDKRGSKLKPAQDGSHLAADGKPAPAGVGAYATRTGPHLVGKGGSMAQLADTLARVLHGPVVDRTGLTGSFDFDVRFSADSPATPGAEAADVAPSLTAAIQEQLGLRVQSGKGPVEILVIDHAEEPSKN